MRSVLAVALALLAVTPACTKTAGVSDVFMSIDEDGARKRTLFFSDSTSVICVFKVGNGRADSTFEALIRQIREIPFGQGGTDFTPVNRVVAANDFHPGPTGGTPAVLSLRLVPTSLDPTTGQQKPDDQAPFAPGSYVCEVSIDGVLEQSAAFNIDYAPCPTAQIVTGQKCAGFYATSPPSVCPRAGASGDPDPTCTCNGETGWSCP